MTLFGGVMLALYQRERTGRGTKVSTSLLANGAWANSCMLQAALCEAVPYAKPTRTAAFNPLVNHYVTRDGKRFIFCLIQADKDWPNLCRALGLPELIAEPRFATIAARSEHARELVALLDAAIAEKDLAEWVYLFAEHDLTWSPVLTTFEAAADQQMQAAGIFVDFEHPAHGCVRTVNSPLFLHEVEKAVPQPAPEIGQHSLEILRQLGCEEAELRQLIERRVVVPPASQ